MNDLKRLVRDNIRQYGMIFALVAILIFFNFYTGGISMTPLNITNLVLQNAYILVLAIGMLLVILTGNIDLSVGSVAALVGAISAILIKKMDVHWIIASAVGLLLGAAIGAFQGYWIAYAKIPAFIVTLAGMLLFRGLTLVALGGQTIGPFPEAFNLISAGFVPDIADGALHVVTILVGVLGSLVYIYSVFKSRRKKIKNAFNVNPLWIDILSTAILIGAINAFTVHWQDIKDFPISLSSCSF